jgi:alkanesulfonate monooxygenase SsuD/methylene tetrahydromethanopterin reductase-like flavin-dependent oxidoreductase (luciferase family)
MSTKLSLGVTLPQFTSDASAFEDGAARAEALGLDSLWAFDHLWPLSGGPERPIFEGWTSLLWLAASTNVTVGTLVSRSSLRHPALLAKMAATAADIAPGRVTIAIGSGDHLSRAENEAFGIPYYAADRRIGQLESTVAVVRAYLAESRISMHDDFSSITDLPSSPTGSVPRVWVGGRSDDTLDLAARFGDGWNAWGGSPERYAQDALRVTEMSQAYDRDVELTWAGTIYLAADDDAALAKLGDKDPSKFVVGGPETVGRALQRFVDAGARHLIASFPDAQDPSVYELFAGPVRKFLEG